VQWPAAVMALEGVSNTPMFHKNTAAFVHDLPATALANVDGDSTYVRVRVLTNARALDRDKQIAVVGKLIELVAAAGGDPSLTERTWVLLTEAPAGGACGATPIPTKNSSQSRGPRSASWNT
jgi:hypothetical protein